MAKSTSHSRAFFLELVVNLLLFALCSAICLQIFAQAYAKSTNSRTLAQASLKVQTAAEIFKSEKGSGARLAELTGGHISGNEIFMYYDKDWTPAQEDQALFILKCDIEPNNLLKTAHITAYKGKDEIISLTAKATNYE